jgi:haloalkane dehalogenase
VNTSINPLKDGDERGAQEADASRAAIADAATARLFNTARRYMRTAFGNIAYVERGEGQAAMFLHGFPLNGFQWRDALERLAPYRRCIAPDFMGLGFTQTAPDRSLAPSAQADMIAALLDSLSIEAVDLVASDSGGAIAQLLVTRHAGRVRTLLLTNCDTEPDCPPKALLPVIEMAEAGLFAAKLIAAWHEDKAAARGRQGIGGLCYSDPAQLTDAALDFYLAPLVATPERAALTDAYARALRPNALAGIEPHLRRCGVPTRIVWGMSDAIFSADSPDYLARTFPNSRGVRRIAEAKLFFPEEYPDLIAEEARRLWAGSAS